MASLIFVLCELVIQVLQLISCSQNMTLAFVKNAIHARVTRKCEKNIYIFNRKDFYEFPLTIGTSFFKNQL